MKISHFISVHKAFALENIANSNFDDADYAWKIYEWLLDIYRRLSNTGVWFYNAVEEIIANESESWIYRTEFPIIRMRKYTDSSWTLIEDWVVAWGTTYTFSPFFLVNSSSNEYTFVPWTPQENWTIVWIKTKPLLQNIKVRYFRAPTKIDVWSLSETDLDIPADLLWPLHNYVSSCVLPEKFYESWASLSNFYMWRYIDWLNNYAASFWSNIHTTLVFK